MGTTAKTLKSLLENIDEGALVLPEIQRDFVWKRKHILQLFDSLYRGLPIGFMLIWKAKKTVQSKTFKSKGKVKVGASINDFYGYLLDGQQRLTAMQLVRDRDDKYPLMFSLWPEDEEKPDEDRFVWYAKKYNNPWYVPVADILSGEITVIQVIEQLKKEEDYDSDQDEQTILASFQKLTSILEYHIGVIEFEDDNYRKATELFIRFNSTGSKLNKGDLAAAELALSVPKLVAEDINAYATRYSPYFNFTRTFLIQCLAAVHTGRMNFAKSRDTWQDTTPTKIKSSWNKTSKGVGRVIELLTGTVKWDFDQWLPSINSIIPLVYLLSESSFNREEKIKAMKWLLKANFHSIFSGSTHTELDRILRGLKNEKSIDRLWRLSRKKFRRITAEEFNTGRKSGGAMSLFIAMIRNKNAKDWESHNPLDGKVIGHNAELQIHHFFPKALLKKRRYSVENINTLANYTVISKNTNLKISAQEPVKYLKELGIKNDTLKKQYIPTNKELWKVENYSDFLNERRRLLAKEANAFLKI